MATDFSAIISMIVVFFTLLMARISEQIIEQIRASADIYEVVSQHVQLKKRGRNFFGLCPFHDEKTASFSINPKLQIYKCFGCSAGGGVINFVMAIERLEFIDAIKLLADQYNVNLKIDNVAGHSKNILTQLYNLHEKTAQIFINNLNTKDGYEVVEYLKRRGIQEHLIHKFKLGYSSKHKHSLLNQIRHDGYKADVMKQSGLFIDTSNGYIDRFRERIMFSIIDSSGKISAFAGRVFKTTDPAKYVNSPETPIYNKSKILYGLHECKNAILKKNFVIVVEGYLDFLQLYQSGIDNCVAVSGTAFTPLHAMQLKRFCNNVYIAYDGDDPGKAAAIRAGYVLLRADMTPHIINLPAGIDPDEWVKSEGNRPFIQALEKNIKLLNFHYMNYQGDISNTAGKSGFTNDVLSEIIQIKDPINREIHAQLLSDLIGISLESILQALNVLIDKRQKRKEIYNSNQLLTSQIESTKQLIEDDLLRLCFTKDIEIRKYIFKAMNTKWFLSELSQTIYEKVYIHLHSNNPPIVSIIMDELKKKNVRNKLADLVFDIDKLHPSLQSAQDCINRLQSNWINTQLTPLRDELKNIEQSGGDPSPIMKKITELQNQKKDLYHCKVISE